MGSFPAGHTDSIRSCAMESSKASLLTGGEDGTICLWCYERRTSDNLESEEDEEDGDDSMES